MKCLNKTFFLSLILLLTITGCGKSDIPLQYGVSNLDDNYNIEESMAESQLDLFASNLCTTDSDITNSSNIQASSVKSAGVFDVKNKETLYSYNANERVYPASLTKVMTALIVLENANLDDIVTVGDVSIKEDGVQLFNLKTDDKFSVRDLLYIDLVYSGNDASLALANHIAGSDEEFANLMNEKAKAIGATNTNFVNSHGLSNENHYTTAYDLYLIFNEAVKYEEFRNIINTTSYDVNYTNAAGDLVTKTITTTNKYLSGSYSSPEKASIVGGKTGSTKAAGKCLILYANDSNSSPYIAVIMGADDEKALYQTMTSLINDTVK